MEEFSRVNALSVALSASRTNWLHFIALQSAQLDEVLTLTLRRRQVRQPRIRTEVRIVTISTPSVLHFPLTRPSTRFVGHGSDDTLSPVLVKF